MVVNKSNPYDIFAFEAQRNHELYAKMRMEDPIHSAVHPQSGHTYWFLTRYDDCLLFLKDRRFGKQFRDHLPAHLLDRWELADGEDIINKHMLNLDNPTHQRLKSLVHLAFTPIMINNLRTRLSSIADLLFDEIDKDIIDGEEFDLTDRYINQFPLLSIAILLGVPLEDYQNLYRWTQHMLETDRAVVQGALDEFSTYLNYQIDLRYEIPDEFNDLLSGLVFAENAGDRLNRQELLAMVFLLITAGYETMVNFISNAITSLFENPDQLRLLQRNIHNPAILKSAIEEMLRYNGPSHMTLASWAFEDVQLGNKIIHQGDVVHAVLYAANRDPRIFENPNTFDILRQPNKHIAFSYGIHHCLGAALARLEGDIAIETLIRRIPNL